MADEEEAPAENAEVLAAVAQEQAEETQENLDEHIEEDAELWDDLQKEMLAPITESLKGMQEIMESQSQRLSELEEKIRLTDEQRRALERAEQIVNNPEAILTESGTPKEEVIKPENPETESPPPERTRKTRWI